MGKKQWEKTTRIKNYNLDGETPNPPRVRARAWTTN